jgi:predicted nucleotidyltransferase component of viral defense system
MSTNQKYIDQVSVLIDLLDIVSKNETFAMHGGTAINLFRFDYPRLSVDIDLTYKNTFSSRDEAIANIDSALNQIANDISEKFSLLKVQKEKIKKQSKIYVLFEGNEVKIEVNQTNRGLFSPTAFLSLAPSAVTFFNKSCSMEIVGDSQLFGGKVVAALDRQHPRDVYDIRTICKELNLSIIKDGILFFLLCSGRPIDELLKPNLIDQSETFINAFQGMTNTPFSYQEFLYYRDQLIMDVNTIFEQDDKIFISSFFKAEPRWDIHNFQNFPSIKWKQSNLLKLKETNPVKFQEQWSNVDACIYS